MVLTLGFLKLLPGVIKKIKTMTLEAYIDFMRTTEKSLVGEIERVLSSTNNWILRTIRNRLYQKGLDGNEKLIGRYSNSTKATKRANGQRSSFITLRDTGDFYGAMYTQWVGNSLLIDSNDIKTDMLTQLYGPAILELTTFEIQFLIDTVVEPAFNKIIEKNQQIELFD